MDSIDVEYHKNIMDAIKNNSGRKLKNLLKTQIMTDIFRKTYLHTFTLYVLEHKQPEHFNMLTKYFNIDELDEQGKTLLMNYLYDERYYYDKSIKMLSMVLKYTKDINKPNKEGKSALHIFISDHIEDDWDDRYNQSNVLKTLLKYGANPFIKVDEMSPIELAIKYRNIELLETIIENQKIIKKFPIGVCAFELAMNKDNHSILYYLIENQYVNLCDKIYNQMAINYIISWTDSKSYTKEEKNLLSLLFHHYIEFNDLESIKIISQFINSLVSINLYSSRIFCDMLQEEKYEIFEYLAETHGIDDMDEQNITPLFYAMSKYINLKNIIYPLIKYTKNINIKKIYTKETALHYLIRHMVDIEQAVEDGEPIEYEDIYTEMVKLLLDKGADPYIQDCYHASPIRHAIQLKNTDVLNMLLESSVNCDDLYDYLSLAIMRDKYDHVEILLQYTTNINARDTNGITILSHAYSRENPNTDIIELLIANGACL